MKGYLRTMAALGLLLLAVLALSACGKRDNPYPSLDQDGYNVSVRYDANGGMFAGTKDVFVVDVFNLNGLPTSPDGKTEVSLLRPDDPKRKDTAFEVSRPGYFLAGWYTGRSLRVNDAGEALDAYGVPTSVSGREQGFIYSGKWDFDSDTLKLDGNAEYESSENVLTLYAAWIPYFNYEFYTVSQDGTAELLKTEQAIEVRLPEWDEKTGKLNMFKFPKVQGKTLDGVYADRELKTPIKENLHGNVDYEKGISTTETIKVYTTWLEGTWYKIYSAEQFYKNSSPSGNYFLCADLDFSDTVWAPALTRTEFTGSIIGNGHRISNISIVQSDISQIHGGLFGSIGSDARFEDVTFENISYKLEAGSRKHGASFGLLAGTVGEHAVFKNFKISGELSIHAEIYPNDYNIGLICGNGGVKGISFESITLTPINTETQKVVLETDPSTGVVTVTKESV